MATLPPRMTRSSEQPVELTVDTMWLGYELKDNLEIQIQIHQ